jgi:GNAT acetyltransferase-like protein
MTIKHSVLPAAHSGTGRPIDPDPSLCAAVLPLEPPPGTISTWCNDSNTSFSVRILQPGRDIPVIYRWMSMEYADSLVARNRPPDKLDESYTCMLESDFTQPYMGLVNDIPVCELDISKARMNLTGLYYPAQKGDYCVNLLLAPLVSQDHAFTLLHLWMKYFFSFPEVDRILTDIESGSEWLQTLFKRAGFNYLQKISLPYKEAELYGCTRDSLRQAAPPDYMNGNHQTGNKS